MACSADYVQYVVDQCSGAGEIAVKKMMGDYCIYCDGVLFGLICDNNLYIKVTEAGATVLNEVILRPPYEGARDYFLVDDVDNNDYLKELVRATMLELISPKAKAKKQAAKNRQVPSSLKKRQTIGMRISILADNRTLDNGRFRTEHGLAVLLQAEDKNILLDTGASDAFLGNAAQLGLDLSVVDYVFLSHGHNDHTGGLSAFLKMNKKAKVIVSPNAVSGEFYSNRGGMHSISVKWPLDLMEGRTVYVEKTQMLHDRVGIIASVPQKHPLPKGDRHLLILRDGKYYPDDFGHEMALYVDGFLFTGCAHSGLENILEACQWPVNTVLGGFHLLDPKDGDTYESETELKSLSDRLSENYPHTTFYTSHCTGDGVFQSLKNKMGERLHHFCCGQVIENEL